MTELVRAAGLSGYERLASELGLDVARVVHRVGLTLHALREPNALISYRALMQLLEMSARDSRRPDFGLRLSQRQGLDILGPVAVVMEHAGTVAEAMELGSRYVFVHSPAIRFSVAPVAGRAGFKDLRFAIQMPNAPARAQTIELSLGVIVQVLDLLCRGRFRPALVMLPHAALSDPQVYVQCYGCACRFDQDYAAVRVYTSALSQTLTARNPLLSELARSYLDTRHVRPDLALSDRVAALVREFLGTERSSQEDIARMLAMHPRTLQRRLREEGTAFEDIKDEVRRDLLGQLLQRSTVPSLTQIAGMLDYAEQSALTRSCRRWFGAAPSALLKRGRAGR